MTPTYLGDGLYAQPGDYAGSVCVFCYNGVHSWNHVYLEKDMIEKLMRYFNRMESENDWKQEANL